jgi:hypothetical protein
MYEIVQVMPDSEILLCLDKLSDSIVKLTVNFQ